MFKLTPRERVILLMYASMTNRLTLSDARNGIRWMRGLQSCFYRDCKVRGHHDH